MQLNSKHFYQPKFFPMQSKSCGLILVKQLDAIQLHRKLIIIDLNAF